MRIPDIQAPSAHSLPTAWEPPQSAPPGQPVLNPLSFPAETDGRFRMLVIGAVMLAFYTLFLFLTLMVVVGSPLLLADLPWSLLSIDRINGTLGDRWIFDLTDSEIRTVANDMLVIQGNAFLTGLPRLALVGLSIFVLLGGSYALYRMHPWYIRRRGRLRPLTAFANAGFAEDVRASVVAISAEAGIRHPPSVEIMTSSHSDAQVFGLPNRYVLRLNARPLGKRVDELGDLHRRRSWPEFRTLVLHELGHIANEDIGRNYFSVVLWRVFIVFVIAPMALISAGFALSYALGEVRAGPADWPWLIAQTGARLLLIALQTLGLVLIVRAIRRGLLRIREFYADWRATLWGAGTTLMDLLNKPDPHAIAEPGPAWWRGMAARLPRHLQLHTLRLAGWWAELWRFHTSYEERRAQLVDPTLLFRISADLPFLTGVLLAFVMIGMPFLLLYLSFPVLNITELISWSMARIVIDWPAPANRVLYVLIITFIKTVLPTGLAFGALFLVAYLVVGSLGRQVQRAAIADLLPASQHVWGYIGLWKTSLLLTAGLELGCWVMPGSIYTIRNIYSLILTPIWLAVFATLTWFWLIYVRALTRCLLGSHVGANIPRIKGWLVTGCSIICLWALYLPMLATRTLVAVAQEFINPPAGLLPPILVELNPQFLFGFGIFVLFSLALLLSIGWALLSLTGARIWQAIQRRRCATCGHAVREPITVGRMCRSCYSPLAAWLYIEPGRKP